MTKANPGDVSNDAIYGLLYNKVLPTLGEISTHLATLNGQVAHLDDRSEAHSTQLQSDRGQIAVLDRRLAVIEAVSAVKNHHQSEQIAETRGQQREIEKEARSDRKELWGKIWEISKTVTEIGVIAAVGAKALGLF